MLNQITYNRYRDNQDKIYQAAEKLLIGCKYEKCDNFEVVKSSLQLLDEFVNIDKYMEFRSLLYKELSKDDYVELYHQIRLLQQYEERNKTARIEEKVDRVQQGVDETNRRLDAFQEKSEIKKVRNVIPFKSKTQKCFEEWEENTDTNIKSKDEYRDDNLQPLELDNKKVPLSSGTVSYEIKGIQKGWMLYVLIFFIMVIALKWYDKDKVEDVHSKSETESQSENYDGKLKLFFWDGKFAYQHWDGGFYIDESDVVEKRNFGYLEEVISPVVYITVQDENGNVIHDISSEHMESCLIDMCYGRYILFVSADNYNKYVAELLLTPENKNVGIWEHNIYFIPETVYAKNIKVQLVDSNYNFYGDYEASIGFQGHSLSQAIDNQGFFELSFFLSKGEYIVAIKELDLHGRFVINELTQDESTIQVIVD